MPSITKEAEKALMEVSLNKSARIAELEAATRAITYIERDEFGAGAVRNSWYDYVDLSEKAPILREVLLQSEQT